MEPHCTICDETYPAARHALGYDTCLLHGAARKVYTAIVSHKSNIMLVTSTQQIKDISSMRRGIHG